MPIDTAGEVVIAALEAVGELALDKPPRRGRWRRLAYWTVVTMFVGLLAFGAYLALA